MNTGVWFLNDIVYSQISCKRFQCGLRLISRSRLGEPKTTSTLE